MSSPLTPLSLTGLPVDWWFCYKVPKGAETLTGDQAGAKPAGKTPGETGYEYFYFDPTADKLVLADDTMSDPTSALQRTLSSVFRHPGATTGWVLYNDEMPEDAGEKDSGSFGHTKGVIAFDIATKSAFWLLHSWPKFADPKATDMPVPNYGQTFLCLAFDLDTAATIARQMCDHQEPQVYSSRIPKSLDKDHPLNQLTQDVDPNAQGDSIVIDARTRGGMPFKVIAKNRKWGKDFWIDLVGPTLKADMDIETWIRGPIPPIRDSDGVHQVRDVKFIDFGPLGYPYRWPETHDHAKWGHTKTGNWVCVGDINRMVSQEKRGGGTIAFQHDVLCKSLHQADSVVVPPGVKEEDVRAAIKKTHGQ